MAGVNVGEGYFLEVAMKKSILVSAALLAGSVLVGSAHAQFGVPAGTTTSTTTTSTGTTVGTPVGGPGVLTASPGSNTLTGAPAGTTMSTTTGTTMAGSGGIGSGMQGGVGAPVGGLDSNPYAEAPQAARALGYPYHPPGKSGSSTLN
jgi:hypothetical protein